MPIGYDFICRNPECRGHNCRLSLSGPWPLVEIDELLTIPEVSENLEQIDGLQKRKSEGRRFACAIMPNKRKLKICGTRIQLYCPEDRIIWDEDLIGISPDSVKLAEEQRRCPRCKKFRFDVFEAKINGLNCPLCNKLMEPNFWFVNE